MTFTTDLGILVAAIITVMIYSFLVRDNPLYKIAEHLSIGLAVGYSLIISIKSINTLCITPLISGELLLIIPLILGLFQYAVYFKNIRFISKWPLSIILGTGTGLAMSGAMKSQILQQIIASAPIPFITDNWLDTLNNFLMALLPLAVLTYFFFSLGEGGVIRTVGKIGRYTMMIGFGAAFGNMTMGRQTVLYGRVAFLVQEYPAYYVTIVAVLISIIYFAREVMKSIGD